MGMPLTTKRGNSAKTIKDNQRQYEIRKKYNNKELTNEFTSHKNNNDTGCYSIYTILV